MGMLKIKIQIGFDIFSELGQFSIYFLKSFHYFISNFLCIAIQNFGITCLFAYNDNFLGNPMKMLKLCLCYVYVLSYFYGTPCLLP